jgi:hypothetical protein
VWPISSIAVVDCKHSARRLGVWRLPPIILNLLKN